jgi:hypothetical protein
MVADRSVLSKLDLMRLARSLPMFRGYTQTAESHGLTRHVHLEDDNLQVLRGTSVPGLHNGVGRLVMDLTRTLYVRRNN